MNIQIIGYDKSKETVIQAAAEKEWELEDWFSRTPKDCPIEMFAGGQSYLCGGESEDEFASRFTEAIWEINGSFCKVIVRATYLEELPNETYEMDEDDYHSFLELNGVSNE